MPIVRSVVLKILQIIFEKGNVRINRVFCNPRPYPATPTHTIKPLSLLRTTIAVINVGVSRAISVFHRFYCYDEVYMHCTPRKTEF